MIDKGRLHGMKLVAMREAFDGEDVGAVIGSRVQGRN